MKKRTEKSSWLTIRKFRYPQDGQKISEFLENRKQPFPKEVLESVEEIIKEVREKGDRALFDYTKKFDGFDLNDSNLEITEDEMKEAFKRTERSLVRALKEAALRIERFHEKFKLNTVLYVNEDGCLLGQLVTPVKRAGIYVPGGQANYPSTVLMNLIPAKVAGVKEIFVCVPPDSKGRVSDATLSALYLMQPTKVFRVGGAQAIAALAFGTESVPKVDVIAGPGNIYVAAAKKMVFGEVGIDMIAGPSEVAIVADETANPLWIARDMMAQSEHDANASSFLITNSERIAREVESLLNELVPVSQRAETISRSLSENSAMFLVPDTAKAIELANAIAPEHLEIETEDPVRLLSEVHSAGAVFLGSYTAESFGDYLLGPNHTLPTQGTARFSSPLSANTFLKVTNVAMASADSVLRLYPHLHLIARAEGLHEHDRSAEERFRELKRKK